MTRAEAIHVVLSKLTDELVIICNGFPSREAFAFRDRPEHFYMIGSMGLASAIGVGIALAKPTRTVVVLDGDGNVLMNMGTLATIAAHQPKNLLHIVFDNELRMKMNGRPVRIILRNYAVNSTNTTAIPSANI